jgi:hypothetical protein
MRRINFALALGTGLLAMAVSLTAMAGTDQQASLSHVEIHPDHSTLIFAHDTTDRDLSLQKTAGHQMVAIPPGAHPTGVRVVSGPTGAQATLLGILGEMRGVPMVGVEITCPSTGMVEVVVDHDGDWGRSNSTLRQHSRGFDRMLGIDPEVMPREVIETGNGTYLILTTDEYAASAQPLADWKKAKGFRTQVVTTSTAGATATDIRDYIRDLYATAEYPPEYLTIIGDVDDVPPFTFSGNVTDHPYSLMDDDDWMADLMVGRLSVESVYEAQVLVNKSVDYERNPYQADPDWFSEYLLVAGNYSSGTPVTTVKWCGEQLESIGFNNGYEATETWYDGLGGVFFPPFFGANPSVDLILNSIDLGVSMVAYRGWAYGPRGWEPPHFTTEHIPLVNNGGMLPVVMSFVCLNGDFSFSEPCFGEVWTRQGTPENPKGAIAFIGNGEHWSHTRYNDAMAISFFERITDPGINTLGDLMIAGKSRFLDYFPHELDFATFGEESVEFYTHIYSLLGDPELNFWKQNPTAMVVDHIETIPVGSNHLAVTVTEADGSTPLAGARIGLVQSDLLLGSGFTGDDGIAWIMVDPITGGQIDITVTCPGRLPYQDGIDTESDGPHLALGSFAITGDDDGLASPAEVLNLTVTLFNGGDDIASGISATLNATGPGATIIDGTASFGNIGSGASGAAADPFQVQLGSGLEDGQIVTLRLAVNHNDGSDVSYLVINVVAPRLEPTVFTIGEEGYALPGETVNLVLQLTNSGRLDASPVIGVLSINNGDLGEVTDHDGSFGSIAVGSSADNQGNPFSFSVAEDVPHGTQIPFTLVLSTSDDEEWSVGFSLQAGLVNPAAPVGPDNYGYYAYDSADQFYEERPDFQWREISTRYGGPGEKVEFQVNDQLILKDLPFDFTYYGEVMDQIRVSDDGWISFDTDSVLDFYNWQIPHKHGNHSILAPFWDNFNIEITDSIPGDDFKDGIYTWYDSDAGKFIVEWSRVRHFKPEITGMNTFQVVLHDPDVMETATGDGVIEFLYRQVDNSDHLRNYATVGFEDPSETDGIQFSYCGFDLPGMLPLVPGLTIRITTDSPVYDPFRLDRFQIQRDQGAATLNWTTSDTRPVLGWRLYRLEGAAEILVTDLPLPAAARDFIDTGAGTDQDHDYLLVALHPWGQESRITLSGNHQPGTATLELSLLQSLPNPMWESTRIDFILPAAAEISLKVYDPAGRLVKTLIQGNRSAGQGTVMWNGRNENGSKVATGVYFYRLETGGRVLTKKLMLVR